MENCILLAACGAHEILPQSADLPADIFTSCLTTPINIALRWYVHDMLFPTKNPFGVAVVSVNVSGICRLYKNACCSRFPLLLRVFGVWFCKFCRFCPRSLLPLDADLIDKIPGQQTDRRTPLGELNWIFTAITDTIAWTVLPRGGHSVSWIPMNSFSYVMLS